MKRTLAALFLFFLTGPVSSAQVLHYAPNGNWDSSGNFLPAAYGFNLADVGASWELAYLPNGVQGLVYVGICDGVTVSFQQAVQPFLGQPKVWGYYLYDDPADHGCPAGNLAAETDYLHAIDGKPVFIDLDNQTSWATPSFAGYNSYTTHADYFGIGPYPCRSEYPGLSGQADCNYGELANGIFAAIDVGIGANQLVVLYQTFCGGSWVDDQGGSYACPSYQQYQNIVQAVQGMIWSLSGGNPAPFDYDYSFGVQQGDTAIANDSVLQQAVSDHNNGVF